MPDCPAGTDMLGLTISWITFDGPIDNDGPRPDIEPAKPTEQPSVKDGESTSPPLTHKASSRADLAPPTTPGQRLRQVAASDQHAAHHTPQRKEYSRRFHERSLPSVHGCTPQSMRDMMPPAPIAPIWRIKVTLLNVVPVIWRRFDTRSDVLLTQLHHLLQGVMGWERRHQYTFHDASGNALSSASRLLDLCEVGSTLLYTYDAGGFWQHLLMIERILPLHHHEVLPRVVAGMRACPPEDCGGPWQYNEIFGPTLLSRPPRHEIASSRRVLSNQDDFDPRAFDIAEAQARVNAYVAAEH